MPEVLPDDSARQVDALRRLEEELNLALADLRSDHRTAFLLFHKSQFSYQEIAAQMDRPVGTVKTWVHRARRHIVDVLQQRETVST